MSHLEIVTKRDFLEYIVCSKCGLCANDCRYECRYIKEKKVFLTKLIHSSLGKILIAIPIQDF